MKKTLMAGTTLVFLSMGSFALAQPPGGGGFSPPEFDEVDADENGELIMEEVSEFFTARFANMPAGGPQGGGAGGPGGGRGPNAEMMFGRWDTNEDGVITRAEWDERPQGMGRGPGGPGGGPGGGQGEQGNRGQGQGQQ